MILNRYKPNNRASKHMQKPIELKAQLEKSTTTVGDFNTPLSIIDTKSIKVLARTQKI